jgi:hypothetical protein
MEAILDLTLAGVFGAGGELQGLSPLERPKKAEK